MLPLKLLRVGRANNLDLGAFARAKELEGADIFIGSCNGIRVMAVFEDGEVWSKEAIELSGAVLSFPGYEFEVDWDTWAALDHLDNKLGSLVVQEGKIFIAVPPPNKVGHVLVEVGETEAAAGRVAYAFPNWRIVIREGDQVHTIFKRES